MWASATKLVVQDSSVALMFEPSVPCVVSNHHHMLLEYLLGADHVANGQQIEGCESIKHIQTEDIRRTSLLEFH